ncbi:MAG: DUF262 domain-containing protein [Acidobacteria bacterium]|nr:DUF262 domain-containing protein [Acidobacteriota bacterium]
MTPTLVHQQSRVQEIIHDFRAGRIVVPEFQRDYVWTPNRAPKLIDSLYRRFPVSSLLVWESDEKVEVRRYAPAKAIGTSVGWLIDGQQRVITLARTLTGDDGIDVVFNTEDEQFLRANAATRKDDRWVRVADVWDEDWYRRYRRNLHDDIRGRKIEERLEKLRSVLEYEVPIVRMIGYNFQDAVNAFQRINTLGVKLRSEDLQSAQVAAKHSGFIRKQLTPFIHDLHKRGFDRITATHLFRACAFIAMPDGRRRTPLHELHTKDVEQAWKRTKSAVEDALSLCMGELGIADMSILWSGSLLVPVIALCGTLSPRDRDDREIAGWVGCAALAHRYSSASGTALEQDLKACRNGDPVGALLSNLRQSRPSLWATPADFNGSMADRSGLLATFLACKQLGASDLLTQRRIVSRTRVDRHHILPRAYFQQGKARQRADVLPNIAFVAKDSNQSISDNTPATYLANISPKVLESQGIPVTSDLWSVAKAEEFWAERQQSLTNAFNAFLKASLGNRRLG